MAETYTHYKILLSCPSDCENKKKVVEESIKIVNATVGETKHLKLELKYWKNDTYPQTGSSGQDIINRQLVDNCDAVIAIFWTKFGSPTDKYGSGTEEEIERMIQQKKQVFLYFCEEPMPPTSINSIEIEKIKDFKKKCESNGLYKIFSNDKELKNKLEKDLVGWLSDNRREIFMKTDLKLSGIYNGKINYEYKTQNIICEVNSQALLKRIKEFFKEIANIDLGRPKIRSGIVFTIYNLVKIDEETKCKIRDFAEKNGISLKPDFFHLGQLSKGLSAFLVDYYEGTSGEKEKYREILSLSELIDEYKDFVEFEKCCSFMNALPIAIENKSGKTLSDIDITLKIAEDDFFNLRNIYIPKTENGYRYFLKENIYGNSFCIKESADYLSYKADNEEISSPVFKEDFFDFAKERNCKKVLNDIFCYKLFEAEDVIEIKVKIEYLKNSNTMAFPTYILLNKKENYKPIQYRINAANIENDIVGEIKIYK